VNPRTTSALRIGAIVSAAAAAALHSVLLALPSLALIVVYGRLLVRAHRSSPARLAELADQPYVMGYSATLSAFVGLLLPIVWTDQLPTEVGGVVLTVAFALASTVVGVATMITLNDVADVRLGTGGGDHPSGAASAARSSAPDPGIEEARLAALAARERRLAHTQAQLEEFVGNLHAQMLRLSDAVTELTALAGSGASAAATFAGGVTQMQQVMQDYVDLVRTVIPTIDPEPEEERIQ
jgi:hypothetical protein